MKLIRTKDGIYERMFPDCETQRISFDHKTIEPAYYTINYDWVAKKDVIAQADTIGKLIDVYVIKDKDERLPFVSKTDFDYVNNKDKANFEVYGAIWVTGKNGEPILRSVAKMNEKGELELL